MRRIIALAFVSLDGVMQAPGQPQEDNDNGFRYGGWLVPHFDERLGAIMNKQVTMPLDLLLGRRTYEIFASYWPEHESEWPGINAATILRRWQRSGCIPAHALGVNAKRCHRRQLRAGQSMINAMSAQLSPRLAAIVDVALASGC